MKLRRQWEHWKPNKGLLEDDSYSWIWYMAILHCLQTIQMPHGNYCWESNKATHDIYNFGRGTMVEWKHQVINGCDAAINIPFSIFCWTSTWAHCTPAYESWIGQVWTRLSCVSFCKFSQRPLLPNLLGWLVHIT